MQNGSKSRPHIIVIGGGISGLAAAHRLLELSKANDSPVHLTLLESSPRLGGIIQTTHRDGFLLERGPDSFISEKPEALELARRLGIESQLIQTNEQNRRSFIVRNGSSSSGARGISTHGAFAILAVLNNRHLQPGR